MTEVFISYARKDQEFVRTLYDALTVEQRATWVDWEGIDYSTKWWEEILAAIEGADNFILIESPDSLNSSYCHREIERARKLKKRIITVYYSPIDEKSLVGEWYTNPTMHPYYELALHNWEELKTIQHIDATDHDVNKTVAAILVTLNINPEQAKLHTQLLLRLQDWKSRGQSPDAFLRGVELTDYETWLVDSDKSKTRPYPTDEQREFISTSRTAEDERVASIKKQEELVKKQEDLNQQQEDKISLLQRVRFLLGLTAVGTVLVAAIASWIAVGATNQSVTATFEQGRALSGQQSAVAREETANTSIYVIGETLTPYPATISAANANVTSIVKTLVPLYSTGTAISNDVESGRFASAALNELAHEGGNPELAALLAIRSLKAAYSSAADETLQHSLDNIYTTKVFKLNYISPNPLSGITVTPDGKYFIIADSENFAQMYDTATGHLIRSFEGSLNSIALSFDGHYLLTGSQSDNAILWDINSGKQLRTFEGHSAPVLSVAWSSDNRFILTGSEDATARVWDANSGHLVRSLVGHVGMINSVAFSVDSKFVVTAGLESVFVEVWSVDTGQIVHTLAGHNATIDTVAISPDNHYIVTGSGDNTAKIWDLQTGQLLQTLSGHSAVISSVAISLDSHKVITGSLDNTAKLWDLQTGQLLRTFTGHTDRIVSVTFPPDGQTVFTVSSDESVRVWSLTESPRVWHISTPDTTLLWESVKVKYLPDGKAFITGSDHGTVRMWDATSAQLLNEFRINDVSVDSLAISPDGEYILVGNSDSTAWLLERETGTVVRILQQEGPVTSAAISPNGQLAVTGSTDTVARIWSLSSGKLLHVLDPVDNGFVLDVAFSPDGKMVLTGSGVGFTRLWDVESGKLLLTLGELGGPIYSVAFTHDRRFIISAGGDHTARMYNATTGEFIRSFEGHTTAVMSISISVDDQFILTGSRDNTIRLWELTTGNLLRIFKMHTSGVFSVTFSPDSRYILSGSRDGTARLIESDYHNFIAYVCSQLSRDFTVDERIIFGIVDGEPTCPQFGDKTALIPTAVSSIASSLPVFTPLPSPTSRPTRSEGIANNTFLVLGPSSGQLIYTTQGATTDPQYLRIRNFIVEMKFINPNNITQGYFGVAFARVNAAKGYFLAVSESGIWYVLQDTKEIARGSILNMKMRGGEANILRLEVLGDEAKLFINGIFVGVFNIEDNEPVSGTGFYIFAGTNAQGLGKLTTRYENLRVWSFDPPLASPTPIPTIVFSFPPTPTFRPTKSTP